MASPAYTTPPRPHRQRSFAGPIVLITIGVLFLLANMGKLSWESMGHWYARYWPVLIIFWGVIKLAEYFIAERRGYRAPGIGAGAIFLIFFLVITGLAASQSERVDWGAVRREMDIEGDFPWHGEQYTYTTQVDQPIKGVNSVQVASDWGAITVNTWDQPTARVVAHKRVGASSKEEADKANPQTNPVLRVEGKTLLINANTGGASGNMRVADDLDVYLPKDASVSVVTRRGDIQIRNRKGDVKADTAHGDIAIEDIAGAAYAQLRHGTLRMTNVSGDATVEGHVGDVELDTIGGAAKLNGEFTGDIKLTKIARGVQLQSSRTEMQFAKLNGELSIDGSELRGDQVMGPFKVITRSKDIHLDNISGNLEIRNSNGTVDVHAGKLPLGTIVIENRRSEVQLVVPAAANFQLEARTHRGDIDTDWQSLKVENSDGGNVVTGVVGNGGPKIMITNEDGAIQVRKAGEPTSAGSTGGEESTE